MAEKGRNEEYAHALSLYFSQVSLEERILEGVKKVILRPYENKGDAQLAPKADGPKKGKDRAMISQPSPTTEPPSGSMRPSLGRYFLRVLLALSLVYYAALVLDLVLHPLGPGVGENAFSLGVATAERYISALIGTGTIVVGAFIMRRVSGNRIGPLLIIWGAGYTGFEILVDYGSPLLTSLAHLIFEIYLNGLAFPTLSVLFLIFPTGQVYPRRAAHWVALYILLYVIAGLLGIMAQSPSAFVSSRGEVNLPVNPFFLPALPPYTTLISGAWGILFFLGTVAAIVSFILRYRAAQTHERQQIKWFIWVTCLVVALAMSDLAIPSDPANALLGSPLVIADLLFFYGLLGAGPAIAIGLAILRSRLWDIDIVINRTLVYGCLTALLALLYVSLIFGLQFLLQVLFKQSNNAVAIVVSTLVIAALFQPLRQYLQNIIDRRFYRRKYDAAKVMAAFSARLRQEVDLDQLREQLLAVVEETMQPTHVSLWLRKATETQNVGSESFATGQEERRQTSSITASP
jgi:hypothetical protein